MYRALQLRRAPRLEHQSRTRHRVSIDVHSDHAVQRTKVAQSQAVDLAGAGQHVTRVQLTGRTAVIRDDFYRKIADAHCCLRRVAWRNAPARRIDTLRR